MKLHEKTTVTCAEMKELERLADENGLSYYRMMENAGSAAADAALEHFRSARNELPALAIVFAGKGNNAGDGFVMARKFTETGIRTEVVLVEGEPVTQDALTNFRLLDRKIEVKTQDERICTCNTHAMLIVDAVYGTGFHGSLRPSGITFVKTVNSLKKAGAYVVSVDIPSGLAGDCKDFSGSESEAVTADLTVTFHTKKPVHGAKGIEKHLGEVVVCDIGISRALENGKD